MGTSIEVYSCAIVQALEFASLAFGTRLVSQLVSLCPELSQPSAYIENTRFANMSIYTLHDIAELHKLVMYRCIHAFIDGIESQKQ